MEGHDSTFSAGGGAGHNQGQLTQRLDCMSCGAPLECSPQQSIVVCQYCQCQNHLLKPRKVQVEQSRERLTSAQVPEFSNLVKILEVAMEAEDWQEAYRYCNRALELDSKATDVWANKAICSFWITVQGFSGTEKLATTNALEIRTFLQAARESGPESSYYMDTAGRIAENLFIILQYQYFMLTPDTLQPQGKQFINTFSLGQAERARKYLGTIETCFDISDDQETKFLKFLVAEYTNNGSKLWVALRNPHQGPEVAGNIVPTQLAQFARIDPVQKVRILTAKIRRVDPDYSPNPWNLAPTAAGCSPILLVLAFILFLAVMAFIAENS